MKPSEYDKLDRVEDRMWWFAAMHANHAVADDAMLLEFHLADAVASFLPGVPALRGVEGVGRVTGKTAQFTATP